MGEKTLRELWWMARGAWDHTAELLALTAETSRDPDKRSQQFCRDEFHPLRQSPRVHRDVIPYNPEILKALAGRGA